MSLKLWSFWSDQHFSFFPYSVPSHTIWPCGQKSQYRSSTSQSDYAAPDKPVSTLTFASYPPLGYCTYSWYHPIQSFLPLIPILTYLFHYWHQKVDFPVIWSLHLPIWTYSASFRYLSCLFPSCSVPSAKTVHFSSFSFHNSCNDWSSNEVKPFLTPTDPNPHFYSLSTDSTSKSPESTKLSYSHNLSLDFLSIYIDQSDTPTA